MASRTAPKPCLLLLYGRKMRFHLPCGDALGAAQQVLPRQPWRHVPPPRRVPRGCASFGRRAAQPSRVLMSRPRDFTPISSFGDFGCTCHFCRKSRPVISQRIRTIQELAAAQYKVSRPVVASHRSCVHSRRVQPSSKISSAYQLSDYRYAGPSGLQHVARLKRGVAEAWGG